MTYRDACLRARGASRSFALSPEKIDAAAFWSDAAASNAGRPRSSQGRRPACGKAATSWGTCRLRLYVVVEFLRPTLSGRKFR